MPLILDLLRHGHALPAGRGADRDRALSPDGRLALERLGARLEREGARHDRVLASPIPRAVESARVLLSARAEAPAVETLDDLAPDSDAARVLEALRRIGVTRGHALLVGHQPLLGQVAMLLTGVEASFAPGSLVRVSCPDGPAPGTARVLLAIHPEGRD